MNTDEVLAAGDPYPQRSVEGLPLRAARDELLEKVMATPTKTPTRNRPIVPRRPRWVAPVVAAAAVAAVVAGAVAVIGPQSETDPKSPDSVAGPAADTPPTSENLRQVVLRQDGWTVDGLDDSDSGGALYWKNGDSTLEVSWYKAAAHDSYLRDRDADDDEKERVSLLGQSGWAFLTHVDMSLGKVATLQGGKVERPRDDFIEPKKANGRPVDNRLRVMTVLPPVGDWFLEFDATVADRAEYEQLMDSLQRVDRRTWLDALDGAVVQPDEAEAFLDEVGSGVPMPPGVTVTPEDLRLPQDPYQARATFVSPVLCGWAEEYADGNGDAIDVLRDSDEWPVIQAMEADGAYPSVIRDDVRRLERNPKYDGWRQGWGC